MCYNCVEYDYESDDWVGLECGCPCAEEDLTPLDAGGATCGECGHKVNI